MVWETIHTSMLVWIIGPWDSAYWLRRLGGRRFTACGVVPTVDSGLGHGFPLRRILLANSNLSAGVRSAFPVAPLPNATTLPNL